MTPHLRIALSPGGLLHVGIARLALANFLLARRHGGRLILRFDDTERGRARPELIEAVAHDLRWLGIQWDNTFRQSERLDRYAAAAEGLKISGRLYPCFESEDELRAKREHRLKRGLAPIYDRGMLKLTPAQRAAAEANGKRPHWRFRLSGETVAWTDLVLGPRQVKLPSLSDPVLIRADGIPLNGLTSAVDDIETGITHVIRTEDHLNGTGVQLDLLVALGADPARIAFGHLPLLAGPDSSKPAKRIEALSLRSLRHDGIEPGALAAYLAHLGRSGDRLPATIHDLSGEFDPGQFSDGNARFDAAQLLALNRRVLRALPFAAVADRLPNGATETFWIAVRGNLDLLSEARGWWDVVAGTIVPPVIEGAQDLLRAALDLLPPEPWDEQVWMSWTGALRAVTGRQGHALFLPLRLALTGEEQGPELRDLLPLIGRARAANRLQIAA